MKGSVKRIVIGSEEGAFYFDVYDCGSTIVNVWTERVLKQHACKNGYRRVWSSATDKKRRSFMVHRLVAMAHLDYRSDFNELDVNHKDGCKSNNDVSNLEWVTKSENTQHALKSTWGRPPGKPVTMEKRDNEIRKLFESGVTRKQLAELYEISTVRISNIIRGLRR